MNTIRKQTINSIFRSIFGLFIFSFGDYLAIIANIGLVPWDSLAMGIANMSNISYGRICIIIALVIVVIDIALKEKIGVGTILDAVLVGTFVDMYELIFHFKLNNNLLIGSLLLIAGMFVMTVGQYYHMSSGLSCGPRDSLMLAIGRRLNKLNIGYVDIIIKVTLIIISFIIKGPIGLGTIIGMFGMGLVMKAVYSWFRFEPRDIKHDDILTTLRKLK